MSPRSTAAPFDAPPAPQSHISHLPFPTRFGLLNLGLIVYGLALTAMIQAGVGLAPWDALHVGLSQTIPGVTVGYASIGAGLLCLSVARVWLGMPVGIGSVLNLVLIGLYIDLFRPHVPTPAHPVLQFGLFVLGVWGVGLATGAYIATDFGAGPRDSLVIGLMRRYGWPVKYTRGAIELLVLGAGWLMGAKIGWGTVLFAVFIGPSMSFGMGLWGLKR